MEKKYYGIISTVSGSGVTARYHYASSSYVPQLFANQFVWFPVGNQKDTQYEITRLELILDDLTAGDAAAAAVKVSPEDSEGILLQQLRLWRQLRKMGLAQEVARLRQQHQQPQHLSDKDEL
jgi:hypothetical protein